MRSKIVPFIAAITWLIISIVLLTLPGSAFPSEDWLDRIWFDKWVHIGMFGLLTLLWCLAWKRMHPAAGNGALKNTFILIAILCIAYGTGMEFVQKYYVPNRSFDVGDIVADSVGAVLGWLISSSRYIKK